VTLPRVSNDSSKLSPRTDPRSTANAQTSRTRVRTQPHYTSYYEDVQDMPRLPTSLLRRAYALDPHLPALLGPCRDLRTAQNELRWLREHVNGVANARRMKGVLLAKGALLSDLIQQRARGKPLQYILGSEWFGDVEIRCRKGVLIPR